MRLTSPALETPAPISEWKIVKGGLVVAVGVVAGQALGFIRHATLAYLLGTGPQADAVAVAFAPVDLLWAVLSTVLIFGYGPLLAARDAPGVAFYEDLARPVVRLAFVAAVTFVVLGKGIVRVLAPGLPAETAALAAHLLWITALAVPAIAWSTLFTALLYSERRFAFPAFHHGMVNLCIIVAALLLDRRIGPYGFAAGYAVGAWTQLAGAWWMSRRLLRSRPAGAPPAKRATFLAQPAPVMIYSVVIPLVPVVTRALASTFGPGATAAFDYSLKLVGVPLAWLVIPLSSSLLSEIAPYRARVDRFAAVLAIRRAAIATALAAGAIVLLLAALGPWTVALLFERGRFTAASTATVSAILTGFAPVLVAWSVLDIISRSLFVLGRSQAPVLAAAVALLANALISTLAPISSVGAIGVGAVVGFSAAAVLVAFYLRAARSINSVISCW